MYGIMDPRQQLTTGRQTIPEPRGRHGLMGSQMGQLGGGLGSSPAMGLFQLYMQNLFKQKYAPPVMPGVPGSIQQNQGFRGFGSPMMPPMQQPQQPAFDPRNPPGQNNFWDFQGGAPGM